MKKQNLSRDQAEQKRLLREQAQIRIDRIQAKLKSLVQSPVLENTIDIHYLSRHHRKGTIFNAGITFRIPGKTFKASARGETPAKALDMVYDEIKEEVVEWKHRSKNDTRRKGARTKEMLRSGSY
jgi:ribosome-associated translation inhibitor RaiA